MTKIDRVADLPEWFGLENYQGLESLGAPEWYGLLSQRQYLLTLQKLQTDDNQEIAKAAAVGFTREIQHIRGTKVESAHIPAFFGEGGLDQYLKDEKRSVHPLTFRHLREHAQNMQGCYHNPEKWFAELNRACSAEVHTSTTTDAPLFLTGHLTGHNEKFAAVRIDLEVPDAVIMESFQAWLKETRTTKGQPRKKKFYRPDFARWARYGVLPYLDLVIWARETETHIPDRVMSAAISSYDAGESNIRKTVAPLAESLMNDLSELLALAALEALSMPSANSETFDS
ncbi:MAG: DUF6387 family protein [Gammaproteobacteria bacterium]